MKIFDTPNSTSIAVDPMDISKQNELAGLQSFLSSLRLLMAVPIISIVYFSYLFIMNKISFATSSLDSLSTGLFLTALILGLPYSSKFIEFKKNNLVSFLLTHSAGAVTISLVYTTIHYYFIIKNYAHISEFEFYFSTLYIRFVIWILVYLFIQIFIYLLLYYDKLLEKTKEEIALKNLITEAELKSLKFQINPHFIFNSLNSIAALTSIEPDSARQMTIMLADFLRATLSTNLRQKVPLSDELTQLRLYASIEKIRFGDKFSFNENVDESLLAIQLPNMLIQPLLENAIKYGVYDALENINIDLIVAKEDGFLAITMENDYEEDSRKITNGSGVGLLNIQSRLSLLYDRNDLIQIRKEKSKFKVILKIPD